MTTFYTVADTNRFGQDLLPFSGLIALVKMFNLINITGQKLRPMISATS